MSNNRGCGRKFSFTVNNNNEIPFLKRPAAAFAAVSIASERLHLPALPVLQQHALARDPVPAVAVHEITATCSWSPLVQ